MKLVPSIAIIAATLSIGLFVGRSGSADTGSNVVAAGPAHQAGASYTFKTQRRGLDRDALRAELRAALAELRPQSVTGSPAPDAAASKAAERSEPSPAQRASGDAGQALVDDAITSGNWTAQDRDKLSELMPELDQDAGLQLLTRLSAAINRGHLKPEAVNLF